MNLPANTLKQQGIDNAIAGAERVMPGFEESAYNWFVFIVSLMPKGAVFQTNEIISLARSFGFETAKGQAWGSTPTRAANNNIIKWNGYAKSESDKCHGTPVSTWIVL